MARHDDSVWGLSLRLARAYGLRARHGAWALAGFVLLGAALSARRPAAPRSVHEDARATRLRAAWTASEGGWAEPRLVATEGGWLLAYTRFGHETRRVEVVALRPDGSLAGAPTAVSTDWLAGRPVLVGAGDCFALAWAGIADREANAVGLSFAVIDAGGRVRVPARRLDAMGTRAYEVHAAYNGRHFAFAAPTFDEGGPVAFAVRAPDGSVVADRRFGADTSAVAVSALGTSWLVTVATHDYDTLRSRLAVSQLSASGEVLGTAGLAAFEGPTHHLAARRRGATTTVWWGQDGEHWSRHTPYFVQLPEGRVDEAPHALGPRQSSSARDVVCDDAGCTVTWVTVDAAPDARPEWMLERRDAAGRVVTGRLRLPSRGGASLSDAPSLAARGDGGAMLAALAVHRRDASEAAGVLVQRLDGEGRPQGAPVRLPLP